MRRRAKEGGPRRRAKEGGPKRKKRAGKRGKIRGADGRDSMD